MCWYWNESVFHFQTFTSQNFGYKNIQFNWSQPRKVSRQHCWNMNYSWIWAIWYRVTSKTRLASGMTSSAAAEWAQLRQWATSVMRHASVTLTELGTSTRVSFKWMSAKTKMNDISIIRRAISSVRVGWTHDQSFKQGFVNLLMDEYLDRNSRKWIGTSCLLSSWGMSSGSWTPPRCTSIYWWAGINDQAISRILWLA